MSERERVVRRIWDDATARLVLRRIFDAAVASADAGRACSQRNASSVPSMV